MKKKDKAMAALLAVFPTRETFIRFFANSDNAKMVRSFVEYASRHNLIDRGEPQRLEDFIARHARGPEDCTPPDGLNFEDLLEKKEEFLRFNLSVRSLTARINALIAENELALPNISNSMLTRLKSKPADTAYKQNVLRSLAFWMGHERADLGPKWNFETLMKLCPENKPADHHREGVRIGFALYSRGDVIDHAIMNWLKKAIKNYMEQTLGDLHGQWGKVRSHDFTTLYVDIPKKEGTGDPASYRSSLKHAVSLAHQMAARWALSRYCTRNRFLSIGIVAGEYMTLDNYLFPLLNAKLSGDPIIRVSDYVRQCLLVSDIRVILCRRPSEATLFNGEALSIWWITAFWTSLYFDFVPDLLGDRVLKNNPTEAETLPQLFWFPEEPGIKYVENTGANALSSFFRFPHNSLLGIEIAKTLYYRRRFQEAIEILRIVLSIDPTDLTARTLRMALFRELALDSPSFSVADNFFRQAEHEALYVLEDCESKTEDFYCEYAAVHLAKAVLALKYLRRRDRQALDAADIVRLEQTVFEAVDRAEYLFEKAMTVSPTAIRSSYSLNVTRVLKAILRDDRDLLNTSEKPLEGKPAVVARPSADFLWQLRLTKDEMPRQHQHDFIENIFVKRFRIQDESISLRSFRPNAHFCHAVALWDFSPVRTVAIARRVLDILARATEMAALAAKDDVCLYSSTRLSVEIMPADDFIRHVKRAIEMVRAVAGEGLERRDGREVMPAPTDVSSSLMTLNFSADF